ncbi:hypothetical protein ACG7TL_008462 [Trametes sanguinea]
MSTSLPSDDGIVDRSPATPDSRLARHWHGSAIHVDVYHCPTAPTPSSSPAPVHDRPDVNSAHRGTFGHGHPNVVGGLREGTFGHGHVTVELFSVVSPPGTPSTPPLSPISARVLHRSGRFCSADGAPGTEATGGTSRVLCGSLTEEPGEEATSVKVDAGQLDEDRLGCFESEGQGLDKVSSFG